MRFAAYLAQLRRLHAEVGKELELAPPATAAAVDGLAASLGFDLPPALREAWLAADGSGRDAVVFARPGYLTGYAFLSVEGAMRAREARRRVAPRYEGHVQTRERDRRVRPGWFQEGWLPFASFGEGTLLLLVDLTPSEGGSVGQIISYTHDPDAMQYEAAAFEDLLEASMTMIASDPEELLRAY